MKIIERLKNNTSAFGLMDPELRLVAEKIGPENFFEGTGRKSFAWDNCEPKVFECRFTYQLRPCYVCQHPEKHKHATDGCIVCSWCGAEIAPEKPKAGWLEFKVIPHDTNYIIEGLKGSVGTKRYLCEAPGMVGFGGIYQESPCSCDCEAGGVGEGWYCVPMACEIHGPWKPTKVRFWEVGK